MKNHDASEVSLTIASYPINDGRGEVGGDFLKLTPKGPAFNSTATLDGEVVRNATHERRYDVSLFLLRTSAANAFLSALHEADKAAPGGAGVGIFQVIDRQSTGTVYFGEHCWITQAPEDTIGEKPALLEWKLEVVMSVAFISGN